MCVSPITIHYDGIDGRHSIQVPCGKCVECLKTKQNDYMIRIREELMQVKKSCFVTLTYSNENVPYFEFDGKKYLTVWKKDVKDWIKRFRTNYERATGKKGIRYFLCSEYGPKTKRPHYHAIFFGLCKKDLDLALRDWYERFGFVLAKDISYDPKSLDSSARYLSKYCSKGVFENPFRSIGKSGEELSVVFEIVRYLLRFPNEVIPSFFVLSNIGFCPSISPFDYLKMSSRVEWPDNIRLRYAYLSTSSDFCYSLSRRGAEAKVCSDWPF